MMFGHELLRRSPRFARIELAVRHRRSSVGHQFGKKVVEMIKRRKGLDKSVGCERSSRKPDVNPFGRRRGREQFHLRNF
jgi:hypothetical protein